MSPKVCVITGGSSGIGKCTAQAMMDAGFTVYELSRKSESTGSFNHIQADVTIESSVNEAIRQVMEKEDHIDVLINNAGFGVSGAVEFTAPADARRQFDVNFFGMVNMNHAVLPIMRASKAGRMISLSSVAGPIPIPFQAYYSATKAAINAYSMALANEVRPFGIEVCTIQPGDIHSGFTSAREKYHQGDEEYGGRISRSVAMMERDEVNGMSPEYAGRFICKVATKRGVKPFNTVGTKYQAFCLLAKLMPAKLLNFLVGKMYAK